nr:peptidase C13 [Pseudomonadota bacterium]
MRAFLAILLAFVAGVALTLMFLHVRPPSHPISAPVVTTQPDAPASRTHLLTPESPPSLLPDKDWPQDAPTPEQAIYD